MNGVHRRSIRGLVAVLALTVAVLVTTSGIAAGVPSVRQANQSYCPQFDPTAKKGLAAVWVSLEVIHKGDLEQVALPLRALAKTKKNVEKYIPVGWAYSGCQSLLLFKHSSIPKKLCIVHLSHFEIPDDQVCQAPKSFAGVLAVKFVLYDKA